MKVMRSSDPFLFFSKREKQEIIRAIQENEMKTSGEIRVHLERRAREDIMAHARGIFQKIGMTRTEARNGVLIFMGIRTKRFCILGDRGIHERVPEGFWDELAGIMEKRFREDRFADGICETIQRVGEKLKECFPYERRDINELPDAISYGKGSGLYI